MELYLSSRDVRSDTTVLVGNSSISIRCVCGCCCYIYELSTVSVSYVLYVLYTYADGDVAHETRTKRKSGRTRHAAACADGRALFD